MNKGIIYFVQPCELVGTNRYNIGCSNNTDLNRCRNGYRKGTRFLCIMECCEPFSLEKDIKKHFGEKFKLIAGCEYFEGDENMMRDNFIKIVNEFINKYNQKNIDYQIDSGDDTDDTDDNDNDTDSDEINSEISENVTKTFLNYQEDEMFGGKKQLIKIKMTRDYRNQEIDGIIVSYIDEEKELSDDNIELNWGDDKMHANYFNRLIANKIIENNCVYDMNDKKFIKNIDKFKMKIRVELCDQYLWKIQQNENLNSQREDFNSPGVWKKIQKFLFKSVILNEDVYCGENNGILKIELFPSLNRFIIYTVKVGSKYFDSMYLRENIPYLIESNDNNEYYIVNRYYEYIGLNTKVNPMWELDKATKWNRTYMYDDGTSPLNGDETIEKFKYYEIKSHDATKEFKQCFDKYKQLTKDKRCINNNDTLIKLLDLVLFECVLNNN